MLLPYTWPGPAFLFKCAVSRHFLPSSQTKQKSRIEVEASFWPLSMGGGDTAI